MDLDRLSWPIRNRDGLLAALRADPAIAEGPSLVRLNRMIRSLLRWSVFCSLIVPPRVARPGLTRLDIPLVDCEVLVDKDLVYLEASMTAGWIA